MFECWKKKRRLHRKFLEWHFPCLHCGAKRVFLLHCHKLKEPTTWGPWPMFLGFLWSQTTALALTRGWKLLREGAEMAVQGLSFSVKRLPCPRRRAESQDGPLAHADHTCHLRRNADQKPIKIMSRSDMVVGGQGRGSASLKRKRSLWTWGWALPLAGNSFYMGSMEKFKGHAVALHRRVSLEHAPSPEQAVTWPHANQPTWPFLKAGVETEAGGMGRAEQKKLETGN